MSQGIVLRIFQELGWDTWDTNVVWPEYQTGEGRADFALCHPPCKPAVFTEVKQPGKVEEPVRQALEYAFHVGVPFVVLTDGRTWSFYLPAEQGSYEDRRVYKLDLYERPPTEAAEILIRYLQREIREGRRKVGALKFSNLLQIDRFEEDLNISRVQFYAPKHSPPTRASPVPLPTPQEREAARQQALQLLARLRAEPGL